jgi:ribosomal 30S subunit maturation factor RimM
MRGARIPKVYRKDAGMTNPTRHETPERQTGAPHLVTQNIDMNGERAGDVKMYSAAAGYLMAWTGPFNPHNLYIPFITRQTGAAQVDQSGYDAKPTAVDSVDVQNIATRLAVGMAVYDAQGKRLGDITQYDVPRKLVVVEIGVFHPRVLFVPFSAIKSVDRDTFSVSLALPKEVVLK